MSRPSVIAIDGPAGVGKSVVSARLAAALGYVYLDTGAIYRAVTLLARRRGIPLDDEARLAELATGLQIRIVAPTVADGRQYTVLVDGEDVTWALFTADVDRSVSQVAAHPAVRQALLPVQREAAHGRVVVAGRDIGTVILPNADLKIYLDASPEVRAKRRCQQLAKRGEPADYAAVLADILRRDQLDSERAAAPLRSAPDAVVIDTDDLSLEEELRIILELCWKETAA